MASFGLLGNDFHAFELERLYHCLNSGSGFGAASKRFCRCMVLSDCEWDGGGSALCPHSLESSRIRRYPILKNHFGAHAQPMHFDSLSDCNFWGDSLHGDSGRDHFRAASASHEGMSTGRLPAKNATRNPGSTTSAPVSTAVRWVRFPEKERSDKSRQVGLCWITSYPLHGAVHALTGEVNFGLCT